MDDLARQLARHWAHWPETWDIAASGDGRWAFWTAKGDHGADIFAAPLTGAHPEQLTFGVDGHDIRAVSQDGARLILGQSRHGSGHDHLLLLDRAPGNRLRLLTPKQEDHRIGAAAFWGEGVLFLSDQGGAGLWWMDFRGARQRLAALPGMGALRVSAGGKVVLAAGGEILAWEGGLRRICAGLAVEWIDEDRIAVLDARGRVGILGAEESWFELGAEAVVAGHGQVLALVGGEALDWRGWRALPNPSGRRLFRPGAAVPGGWLGLGHDEAGPGEVWSMQGAGQRLDRFAGRGHVAPRRAGKGLLYLPQAPRGLILWPDAPGDRADPVLGFFTELGWAVLSPGDAPERAIEAALGRSVAPRIAVLDLGQDRARCGLWVQGAPGAAVAGLRVIGLGAASGPPGPGEEVLRLEDEWLGLRHPANLETFFRRAAALLDRAFP